MQHSKFTVSSSTPKPPLSKKLLFGAASAATVAIVGSADIVAAAHGVTSNTINKPTSKDQCSNFASFTDENGVPFKNRGQCVSWVEHNVLGHGYGGGRH